MKTIILGPPGTGKTTTLLNLVEDFLRAGTDIKKDWVLFFYKESCMGSNTQSRRKIYDRSKRYHF